jgi:hypothetical protein
MGTRAYDMISGVETSASPSPSTPSVPSDVITKAYADTAYEPKNPAGIVSKTTTYTATTVDDVILCSTASPWTLNLYTAVGNTGRMLRIIKTSSDFNALTIDANGSQTIRGSLTFLLHTQWQSVTIVSDGANWQVVDHYIPSEWVSYTPSLESNGGGSITLDTGTSHLAIAGRWRRSGDSIEISFGFRNGQGGAASGTAGTVLVSIPSGLTINGTKLAPNGVANSTIGTALLWTGSAFQTSSVYQATTTAVAFVNHNASGSVSVASLAAGVGVSGTVRVPISGWEP